jgi:hypothetical protein
MPYLLTLGCLLIAWTLLSVLGRERERRVQSLHAQARAHAVREKLRREREAAPPVVR